MATATRAFPLEKVLDLLACPISYELIEDPVIDKCGHTFERATLEGWLATNPRCPLSNQELHAADLTTNFALRDVIAILKHHQSKLDALDDEEQEILNEGVNIIAAKRAEDVAVGIFDRVPADQRRPSLARRITDSVKRFYGC